MIPFTRHPSTSPVHSIVWINPAQVTHLEEAPTVHRGVIIHLSSEITSAVLVQGTVRDVNLELALTQPIR
jgi:hypothetical protein